MVSEYSGQGLGHRPIGQVFLDIVRAAVDSGVRLPPETAMIGKTLYNLEATARTLSPEFNPSESIRTNSAKLMRKRMLKSLSPENLFGGVLELREFVDRLPNRLNRIFDAAADNQLGLKVDTGIDAPRMMLGFQKVANRIATGLVLAALIVGAAMLMQVETSFRLLGYPGFAIIRFLLAVAGGIAMVLTIVAHDRRDQRNAAGR
jgi:predicted unusual protein kinase regulating ubiquinone biosynthesis (AarF/ABC1/UbiB family)